MCVHIFQKQKITLYNMSTSKTSNVLPPLADNISTKKNKWVCVIIVGSFILFIFALILDSLLYYTSPLYHYKLTKLILLNYSYPLNFSRHVIHF